MYPLNLHVIMRDLVMPRCCFGYVSLDVVMFRLSFVVSFMYPMNLYEIMRDLVMPRCCFGYVSFEPVRDNAGFGYASLLFRFCFVGCGYVSFVFVVSVMFL